MLAYFALILLFGLGFALVSALLSIAIARGLGRIFRSASIDTIALVGSGVVPVVLMILVAASLVLDDWSSGPGAQGLLIITGISFLATMIGWPLGYRFGRRSLTRRGQ